MDRLRKYRPGICLLLVILRVFSHIWSFESIGAAQWTDCASTPPSGDEIAILARSIVTNRCQEHAILRFSSRLYDLVSSIPVPLVGVGRKLSSPPPPLSPLSPLSPLPPLPPLPRRARAGQER